jgi:transposase
MQTVSTLGLDIAKSLFQVHGIDAAGQVVIRRQLRRRYLLAFFEKLPPFVTPLAARATGTVRLMPPAYAKPYVKRQKNDMADAEGLTRSRRVPWRDVKVGRANST